MSRFYTTKLMRYPSVPPHSLLVNGDTNLGMKMRGDDASAYSSSPAEVNVTQQQIHFHMRPPHGYEYEFEGAGGQRPGAGHQQTLHGTRTQEEERQGQQSYWQYHDGGRGEDWYDEHQYWPYQDQGQGQGQEWTGGQRDWQYPGPVWNSINNGSSYQASLRAAASSPARQQARRQSYRDQRYAPYHPQEHSSWDWARSYQHRPELTEDYSAASILDEIDENNIIQGSNTDENGARRSTRWRDPSQQPAHYQPPLRQSAQQLPHTQLPHNFFSSYPPALPQQPVVPQPSTFLSTSSPSPQLSAQQQVSGGRPHPKGKAPPRSEDPLVNLLPRPIPTQSYLQNALEQPRLMDSPRPLLVVLDLNGTLLCRKDRRSSYTGRPRVKEFLHYLFSHHLVMVWSSARPQNVDKMCGTLFDKEHREKLVAIWARDKLRLTEAQYGTRVQVYKQLSWIWEDATINGKKPWSQADTVLIDDSMEKAASEPHNIIEIEEFEAKKEQMETDVLGQVISYLEILSYVHDVSAYIRAHPFKHVLEAKADTPMQ